MRVVPMEEVARVSAEAVAVAAWAAAAVLAVVLGKVGVGVGVVVRAREAVAAALEVGTHSHTLAPRSPQEKVTRSAGRRHRSAKQIPSRSARGRTAYELRAGPGNGTSRRHHSEG